MNHRKEKKRPIAFTASEKERTRLDEKAELHGMSRSQYIRSLIQTGDMIHMNSPAIAAGMFCLVKQIDGISPENMDELIPKMRETITQIYQSCYEKEEKENGATKGKKK